MSIFFFKEESYIDFFSCLLAGINWTGGLSWWGFRWRRGGGDSQCKTTSVIHVADSDMDTQLLWSAVSMCTTIVIKCSEVLQHSSPKTRQAGDGNPHKLKRICWSHLGIKQDDVKGKLSLGFSGMVQDCAQHLSWRKMLGWIVWHECVCVLPCHCIMNKWFIQHTICWYLSPIPWFSVIFYWLWPRYGLNKFYHMDI